MKCSRLVHHRFQCIIGSRLDYCNAILAGLPAHSISRLQRVQTSAAKIVLNVGRRSSSTAALRELHWLPVSHRIDFKVSLLTFKTLTTSEPKYLYGLLDTHVAARATRSAACHSLQQPLCSSVLASRAFCFHAPKLWNVLPPSLRQSVVQPVTVDTFKRNLKALHFSSAFNLACQTV